MARCNLKKETYLKLTYGLGGLGMGWLRTEDNYKFGVLDSVCPSTRVKDSPGVPGWLEADKAQSPGNRRL